MLGKLILHLYNLYRQGYYWGVAPRRRLEHKQVLVRAGQGGGGGVGSRRPDRSSKVRWMPCLLYFLSVPVHHRIVGTYCSTDKFLCLLNWT